MLVPGAYFRDEVIWRGRVIAFMSELRCALFELGFWLGAMYLAFAVSGPWGDSFKIGVGVLSV
jgi:hypothetical protein